MVHSKIKYGTTWADKPASAALHRKGWKLKKLLSAGLHPFIPSSRETLSIKQLSVKLIQWQQDRDHKPRYNIARRSLIEIHYCGWYSGQSYIARTRRMRVTLIVGGVIWRLGLINFSPLYKRRKQLYSPPAFSLRLISKKSNNQHWHIR